MPKLAITNASKHFGYVSGRAGAALRCLIRHFQCLQWHGRYVGNWENLYEHICKIYLYESPTFFKLFLAAAARLYLNPLNHHILHQPSSHPGHHKPMDPSKPILLSRLLHHANTDFFCFRNHPNQIRVVPVRGFDHGRQTLHRPRKGERPPSPPATGNQTP